MKLKHLIITILSLGVFQGLYAQKLKDQTDSVSYALGITIASQVKGQGMKEIDIKALSAAFEGIFKDDSMQMTATQANMYVSEYFQKLQMEQFEEVKKKGKEFLAENKKKKGVVETESGLQYKVLKEGTGASPGPTDAVTVHYHGTLLDGTVFDSSVERGQPLDLNVNGVIKGWQEALQLMKEGAKYKLWIPYDLGYGAKGAGQVIGPYETLVFEVELISVNNQSNKEKAE